MSKILYSIIDDLLEHAYEEALDLSIYLKKLIKLKKNENAKRF